MKLENKNCKLIVMNLLICEWTVAASGGPSKIIVMHDTQSFDTARFFHF